MTWFSVRVCSLSLRFCREPVSQGSDFQLCNAGASNSLRYCSTRGTVILAYIFHYHIIDLTIKTIFCVRLRVCVRACVRACVCACSVATQQLSTYTFVTQIYNFIVQSYFVKHCSFWGRVTLLLDTVHLLTASL